MSKVPLTRIDPAGAANGDLIQRQSGIWVPRSIGEIIPGGSVGEVLTKQSSTDGDFDWNAPASAITLPEKINWAGPDGFCYAEDFASYENLNGLQITSPISLTNYGPSDQGSSHPGVLYMFTGTSTSIKTYVGTATSTTTEGSFKLGSGRYRCGWYVKTGGALSDATNNFYTVAGFYRMNLDTNPASQIVFYYNHGDSSGNWTCQTRQVTAGANDSTITNSGVAWAVDTWYLLEIEINAAGTEVKFYINGSLVQTHTTDITTANLLGWGAGILKFAGSSNRAFYIDYAYLEYEATSSRFTLLA